MKKICIITTQESSIKNWFVPILDIYPALGLDVTVVSKISGEFAEQLKHDFPFVHVKSFPFPRGISVLGSFSGIAQLTKFFRKEKFDYIQYHTPNGSLYGSVAGWLCRIPIRVYGQWGVRYVSEKGFKRKILKFLEKVTCRFSTQVHAQSPKNRQFNIDEKLCPPDKISVIGIGGTIGVDFAEFDFSRKQEYRCDIRKKLSLTPSDFVFGFIGRIHRDKGVNELAEAFRGIEHSKLLIIGDCDKNYPPTEATLQYLKTDPDVIYLDRIPRSDVGKYLSAMDVFVYPTYREGFGHVLQEAMTMALPVITTDIPGPSEVVECHISGELVPVQNSGALRTAMELLRQDEQRRIRYAVNARKRAEEYFEKSIMVSHVIDDYKETLRL